MTASSHAGPPTALATAAMFAVLSLPSLGAQAEPRLVRSVRAHLPDLRNDTVSIAAVDVDGNGLLDLVEANFDGPNRVLLQVRPFWFVEDPSALPPANGPARDVCAADVDADGDMDLFFANDPRFVAGAPDQLLINDGTGRFVDETGARATLSAGESRRAGFLDVDADGDPDLWIGSDQDRIFVNDGNGFFTDETSARMPVETAPARDFVAADLDGDGDVDFVTSDAVYDNDGAGVFTSRFRFRGVPCLDVADLDGDGDLDILCPDEVFLNDGSNTFASGQSGPIQGDARGIVLRDLDGDGDADAVVAVAEVAGAPNEVYFNDGAARFTRSTTPVLPVDRRPTYRMATGWTT